MCPGHSRGSGDAPGWRGRRRRAAGLGEEIGGRVLVLDVEERREVVVAAACSGGFGDPRLYCIQEGKEEA